MKSKVFSLTGLIVAVLLFVAVNAFANVALKRSRIDLTEKGLFSLSEGSKAILDKLEEPVDLAFYFTPEQAKEQPMFLPYAQRVRELLQEYEIASDGNVRLSFVDPKPFTEEEDAAAQGGLQGYPINQVGDKFYFGLIASNSVDEREVIPFFDPSRESSLEYDITQRIYRLSGAQQTVVGMMSSLPISGGPPDPRTGRPGQRWGIYDYIAQTMEVRDVAATATSIDEDVNVLMIVHPKELSQETLYAIDQFALRGGRVVAFVDPHCIFDPAGQQQRGAMTPSQASNLDPLLAAWGVRLEPNKLIGDESMGNEIPSQTGGAIFCPLYLNIDKEGFTSNDLTTAELSAVSYLLGGAWETVENAQTEMTPVLQTTEAGAGALEAVHLQFGQMDFDRMSELWVKDKKRRQLAVRVTGPITTAFPDGKPEAAPVEGEETPEPEEESTAEHITESSEPFHAVLIADADMLVDQLWVQRMGPYLMPQQGNGSFVVNVLENLSGSSDMISLRSREGFQRPFSKKAELEKQAGERLQAKKTEIETAIKETEARIAEMQGPRDQPGAALLSPEQEAEIEEFNRKYLEQRKELRGVKNQLNEDIKWLGSLLKFFNTFALPALLLLIPLILQLLKVFSSRAARSRRSE